MSADSAAARAQRLYPRSKNFRSTYLRGHAAARAGRSRDACPYKLDGKKTWSLAYRRAWLAGFASYSRSEDA